MLAPFAALFFPLSGVVGGFLGFWIFIGRRERWQPIFWLPVALWNLLGSLAFLSAIGLMAAASQLHDEAGGFAGVAALFMMGRTGLFVLGLILCIIAFPRGKNGKCHLLFISVLLSILIFGGTAFATRRAQPVHLIDLGGNPVSNVWIHFQSGEESRGFNTSGSARTDDKGEAVAHGYYFQRMEISVRTGEYYGLPTERGVSIDLRTQKELKPVTFHLKKKGKGEPLLERHFPEGMGQRAQLRHDGTPLELDLIAGKQVAIGSGQLKLEFWRDITKPDARVYDWKLRLTITNAGIIPTKEEFPFEAPETGYQPSVTVDMPATNHNWQIELRSKYYIKLNNGNFGRIDLYLFADNGVFTVSSHINPAGSRYLEPAR